MEGHDVKVPKMWISSSYLKRKFIGIRYNKKVNQNKSNILCTRMNISWNSNIKLISSKDYLYKLTFHVIFQEKTGVQDLQE